jgi:hypothetical protein
VFERPGVQGIARSDIDVGLELARVVDQVERAADAARCFEAATDPVMQ